MSFSRIFEIDVCFSNVATFLTRALLPEGERLALDCTLDILLHTDPSLSMELQRAVCVCVCSKQTEGKRDSEATLLQPTLANL